MNTDVDVKFLIMIGSIVINHVVYYFYEPGLGWTAQLHYEMYPTLMSEYKITRAVGSRLLNHKLYWKFLTVPQKGTPMSMLEPSMIQVQEVATLTPPIQTKELPEMRGQETQITHTGEENRVIFSGVKFVDRQIYRKWGMIIYKAIFTAFCNVADDGSHLLAILDGSQVSSIALAGSPCVFPANSNIIQVVVTSSCH